MQNINFQKIQIYLFIISFAGIMFLPFIGQSNLFDWDEINFAESAREMIVTGDYLTVRINYEPFHEKPPLFIIFQAISMNLFGINEFAARFPNAIMGIITLLVLFNIGKKLKDEKLGFLMVITYSGSILSHFYFKTAIIDPYFNFFMFLSIYFLYKYYLPNSANNINSGYKNIIIAGIFSGLAVITKGPVGFGLVFVTLVIYHIINRKEHNFPILGYILFIILSFSFLIVWYAIIIIKLNSYDLAIEFIKYQIRLLTTQDAGHGGPIYYHIVVLLFGMFPSSILAIRGIRNLPSDNNEIRSFSLWMKIIFAVVLIVFSIVNTKIVHYSSMAYFPISFLAAKGIYSILYENNIWKKSTNWLIAIVGGILAIFAIIFPIFAMNISHFISYFKDPFTREILSGKYHWDGNEWLPGAILLLSLIITLFYIFKKKYLQGTLALYGGSTLFIVILLPFLVPKIEQYTQLTPITFFKSLKGEDCYIFNYGYKTYAHYFYAEMRPEQSRIYHNMSHDAWENWLLYGNPDKTTYIITKYPNKEKLEANPSLRLLFSKNGWVVFVK